MLVLDEADVMVDMGFKNTLNTILENLPKCQTLLFSATLNKSIYALANLSLTEPEKVYLHNIRNQSKGDNSEDNKGDKNQTTYDVPTAIKQYYMIVKPE